MLRVAHIDILILVSASFSDLIISNNSNSLTGSTAVSVLYYYRGVYMLNESQVWKIYLSIHWISIKTLRG